METNRLKDGPSYFHFLQVRLFLLLSQTRSILQHMFKLTVSDMIFRNMQPFFVSTLLDINNEVKCAVMWGFATSTLTTQRRLRHWKGAGLPVDRWPKQGCFSHRALSDWFHSPSKRILLDTSGKRGGGMYCAKAERSYPFLHVYKKIRKIKIHINTVNPLNNHFYVRLCIFNINQK